MSDRPLYSDDMCTGRLVVGAARGVRAFHLTDDGVLRGVTYAYAWHEGENESQCYVTRRVIPEKDVPKADPADLAARFVKTMGGVGFPHDMHKPPEPRDGFDFSPCRGLAKDCACGFYGYHDSILHGYANNVSFVHGVIEGYGKVILGPNGFRASKARLVAVTSPHAHLVGVMAEAERTLARLEERLVATSPDDGGPLIADHLREQISDLANNASRRLNRLRLLGAKHFNKVEVKMREKYPNTPVFDTMDALLDVYPVENLGYLTEG